MNIRVSEEEKNINEAKKAYLRKHRESVEAVKRIELQIKELELDEMMPSVSYRQTPTAAGYNNHDLSSYIVKKDKLLDDMLKVRYERISIYQDIFNRIESMENEDERQLLTLRYIRCMDFYKICEDMKYEIAQIHRIHARALQNFPYTPQDDR